MYTYMYVYVYVAWVEIEGNSAGPPNHPLDRPPLSAPHWISRPRSPWGLSEVGIRLETLIGLK